MLRQRQPRVHDESHLTFIRSLVCVICGDNTSVEAAHLRVADARAAKRYVGKSEKPDDRWALPMCGGHHRQQHNVGEHDFWKHYDIDPVFVALALSSVSGEYGDAIQVIENARRAA